MSFAWQDIRYGWKALAGIVLTGATIYVAVSTRQRVTQRDIIEIVLGTYERCLGTQYGTNEAGAPLYYVAPPEFTRDWVDTNGAGGWQTNAVTNAIGWRSDRAMLVACDALIKACVPYYADTGTLEALTVTGLWATLGIGDGTNLFTREPKWVGTNGVTNAATYGEYPYRVYKTDLEERYKVLQALQQVPSRLNIYGDLELKFGWSDEDGNEGYNIARSEWLAMPWSSDRGGWDNVCCYLDHYNPQAWWDMARVRGKLNITNNLQLEVSGVTIGLVISKPNTGPGCNNYFYPEIGGWPIEGFYEYEYASLNDIPEWLKTVGDIPMAPPLRYPSEGEQWADGWSISYSYASLRHVFHYATNRYW